MSDEQKPVLLSKQMSNAALGDPEFYRILPEFIVMKGKLLEVQRELAKGGCSGCRARGLGHKLATSFVQVANGLSEDGRKRLREYYGVTGIMVTIQGKSILL
jgi:hypothetical protein